MKNIEGNEPFLPGLSLDSQIQTGVSEEKVSEVSNRVKVPENMRTPKFEKDDDPGAYHRMQWKGRRQKGRK